MNIIIASGAKKLVQQTNQVVRTTPKRPSKNTEGEGCKVSYTKHVNCEK